MFTDQSLYCSTSLQQDHMCIQGSVSTFMRDYDNMDYYSTNEN